jgi:hypothetical protein
MVLKVRHLVNVVEIQDEPQPETKRAPRTKKTTIEAKPSDVDVSAIEAVDETEALAATVEEPTTGVAPRKRPPRKKAPVAATVEDPTAATAPRKRSPRKKAPAAEASEDTTTS